MVIDDEDVKVTTDDDDIEVEDKKKTTTKEEPKLSKSEWQSQFETDVLPKRLARKEKEVLKALGLNSLDEYATIASKAKDYDEKVAKDQTEEDRRAAQDAERDRQLAALQSDLKARDHKILIGEVADELEVPKKLRKFLQGDDEDTLRESAQALLDAMSEVGGPKNDTKKTTTQDSVKEKKVVHGGGGPKPDQTVDTKKLAEKIYKSGGVLAR